MGFTFDIPWDKFISLTLINFFAIASPGPALVVQMKQSMNKGYRLGLMFAIGVGLGIGVHLLYIFMGLAKVIASYSWLETIVILVAIGYFSFLFWSNMKTPRTHIPLEKIDATEFQQTKSKSSTDKGSLLLGFFVSAVNPNAVVFMITMFAPLIDKDWNTFSCFIMLIWLCFCCFLYYALLNALFSNSKISKYYFRYRFYFDRFLALFFLYLVICFGAKLLPPSYTEPIQWLLYF